jgi:hypothetical protein
VRVRLRVKVRVRLRVRVRVRVKKISKTTCSQNWIKTKLLIKRKCVKQRV